MATSATYYLDAPTFETASAIYSDAALTTKATDGFYSNGIIVREQSSGVLLASQDCSACEISCGGGAISYVGGNTGYFELSFDMGASTGAIKAEFDPNNAPKGIVIEYDGSSYNTASSPTEGALETSGDELFIGKSSEDCGISGNAYSLDKYRYGTSSFIDTGDSEGVAVDAGEVDLSTAAPGSSVITIPKPNASPSGLTVKIYAPCSQDTDFDITIPCPVALTGFTADTTTQGDIDGACLETASETLYNMPVNGSAGTIGVFDLIYTDENGETTLESLNGVGFYKYDDGTIGGGWFQLGSSSVVLAKGSCPVNWTVELCGGGATYVVEGDLVVGQSVEIDADPMNCYEVTGATTSPSTAIVVGIYSDCTACAGGTGDALDLEMQNNLGSNSGNITNPEFSVEDSGSQIAGLKTFTTQTINYPSGATLDFELSVEYNTSTGELDEIELVIERPDGSVVATNTISPPVAGNTYTVTWSETLTGATSATAKINIP